jgi:hypothetical protein
VTHRCAGIPVIVTQPLLPNCPLQNSALHSTLLPHIEARDMDFDMNWWGLYAMPLGVAICFGPVLVAWALAERTPRNERDRH